VHPTLATDYDNLVYACATCNSVKAEHELPDPAEVLLRDDIHVAENGTIEGDTPEARRLIRVLGLDDLEYTEFGGCGSGSSLSQQGMIENYSSD
jgi:hypothetical protein